MGLAMMNRILIFLISFTDSVMNVGVCHADERYALICRAIQSVDYPTGKVTDLIPEDQTFINADGEHGSR